MNCPTCGQSMPDDEEGFESTQAVRIFQEKVCKLAKVEYWSDAPEWADRAIREKFPRLAAAADALQARHEVRR